MQIPTPHQVHVWQISLLKNEDDFVPWLQKDELDRANRFHFPKDRRRFIIARGALRDILARYTNLSPQALEFSYLAKGKPFLADSVIEFNLSHSHELALVAVTFKNPIGVDIEKISASFMPGVAERYFSPEENALLSTLSPAEQTRAFYRIWARKEAILKGIGQGIGLLSANFHTDIRQDRELVHIHFEGEQAWYVQDIQTQAEYASAYATAHRVDETLQFIWEPQ